MPQKHTARPPDTKSEADDAAVAPMAVCASPPSMLARNAAITTPSSSTSTTTIRSISVRAFGASGSFFEASTATNSTSATPVSKADTENKTGSSGVFHKGTFSAAMSSMPVYTATNAASAMPTTASARRNAIPCFSNHAHFFANRTSTGRVASSADAANTAMAANAPHAPYVIHEVKWLKLCHIRRPRAGCTSSESKSSKPAARLASAAHIDTHTIKRWRVRSIRNSTAAMMNAPAPMPPKNR